MSLSTASYLARRAAQKERVRLLYRWALKDTLNWVVHRRLFYEDADVLREKFEANKHVEDLDTIDRLIDDAEATYRKWQHPDPYIDKGQSNAGPNQFRFKRESLTYGDSLGNMAGEERSDFQGVPWAPGGTKFTRNPVLPPGIEIAYDYGKEDDEH